MPEWMQWIIWIGSAIGALTAIIKFMQGLYNPVKDMLNNANEVQEHTLKLLDEHEERFKAIEKRLEQHELILKDHSENDVASLTCNLRLAINQGLDQGYRTPGIDRSVEMVMNRYKNMGLNHIDSTGYNEYMNLPEEASYLRKIKESKSND